jgi:hypothetical protein
MKMYWESEGIAPQFLTSALDGSELSASCFDDFILGENYAGTPWIGASLGPRIGLDAVAKRKHHVKPRSSSP